MSRTTRRLGGVAVRRWALLALSAVPIALAAAAPGRTTGSFAPFAGAINVVPSSPKIGSCIPFANNVDFGFSGFVFRQMAPFVLRPGTRIAFDLAATNDVDVRRDIYFSATDHDPGPNARNVRATDWIQVVSTSQTPAEPRGNGVIGDYELVYRAERGFTFNGGGLAIGFAASPPSAVADRGCEQVGVHTTSSDPSGHFYARFWSKAHLEKGVLDIGTSSSSLISGFVLFVDTDPPVVSAIVTPDADEDGWIDPASGPVRVTWTGTDDGSGIASCDDPVELTEPGTHVLYGTCTDVAGNIGAGGVTVKIARRIAIDVVPGSPVNPFNVHRGGAATFLVSSDDAFDALSVDVPSMRFGGTGAQDSVDGCQASRGDLLCWFDVERAALRDPLVLKAYADDVRVIGSDAIRLVGR